MLGEEFVSEAELVIHKIQQRPESGKPGKHGTRSYKVRRFPFRFFYQTQPDRFWIIAVAHSSRRPGYWVRRLF